MGSFELEHLEAGEPKVAYVAVGGEIDLTNADELVEQLDALSAGRPLVLDLNRLVFLDSAALHRLFDLARERGAGGLAVVIEPGAPVAATLEIVEFRKAASVTASVDDARAALVHTSD